MEKITYIYEVLLIYISKSKQILNKINKNRLIKSLNNWKKYHKYRKAVKKANKTSNKYYNHKLKLKLFKKWLYITKLNKLYNFILIDYINIK